MRKFVERLGSLVCARQMTRCATIQIFAQERAEMPLQSRFVHGRGKSRAHEKQNGKGDVSVQAHGFLDFTFDSASAAGLSTQGNPFLGARSGLVLREMSDSLVVNEIYLSLQGESTFAGLPCIFVRLTACNLRCSYCDTAYAFTEGSKQKLSDIVTRIR